MLRHDRDRCLSMFSRVFGAPEPLFANGEHRERIRIPGLQPDRLGELACGFIASAEDE